HIHEKIDFTVEVFIVYKDKVLLRFHDKYKIWLSVGGHVELNEDPNQAAMREVKEEVGLDVQLTDNLLAFSDSTEQCKELIPPQFLNIHRINDSHEHITLGYFATASTDVVIPEKVDDQWKWLTSGELETMDLRPNIKFYAQKALKELGLK
ncbi:MAG: hypothetical protein JWO73_667, partial [Candidatus Taylorbacteria bacterium]|nr:hypothetical protein [Candidatus Taylorbacteria bacterium]